MVQSWDQLLKSVPTEYLHDAYTAAMQEHCGSNGDPSAPFKAGLILAAYIQMCASGRITRALSTSFESCRWCNGRGIERVRWVGCFLPRSEPIRQILEPMLWDSAEPSDGLRPCEHRESPQVEESPEEARNFSFKQAIGKLKSGFDPTGVSNLKHNERLTELREQAARLLEVE